MIKMIDEFSFLRNFTHLMINVKIQMLKNQNQVHNSTWWNYQLDGSLVKPGENTSIHIRSRCLIDIITIAAAISGVCMTY